jgi:hypothetical protein
VRRLLAFFGRIQQARPLQNIWARLGVETPTTAFPLLEYLVHTSDDVGEGCKQLGRYLRLVGAPFTLDIRDDEDPIRVVYLMAPWTSPTSAEYGVAIHVCRVREETDNQVQLHMRASRTSRTMSWKSSSCSAVRSEPERRGPDWQCRARRGRSLFVGGIQSFVACLRVRPTPSPKVLPQ